MLYKSIELADDTVVRVRKKFVLKIESNAWEFEFGKLNGFFIIKQIEKP